MILEMGIDSKLVGAKVKPKVELIPVEVGGGILAFGLIPAEAGGVMLELVVKFECGLIPAEVGGVTLELEFEMEMQWDQLLPEVDDEVRVMRNGYVIDVEEMVT